MNSGHPNASNYIDGMLVHWYLDKIIPTSYLDKAHSLYPNKFIFNSESSISKIFYLNNFKTLLIS